jgi:hypothetical protein
VTALRLVWETVEDEAAVQVAGVVKLYVFADDVGRTRWCWSVTAIGDRNDGYRREVGGAATLEAAQLAAEAAALSLLVDALAAYGTRPPDGYEVMPWPEQEGVCEAGHVALKRHGRSIGNPYPDDAIALGVAIVAAGVAARKAGA